MKKFLFISCWIISSQLWAQSYNGPESVDYHQGTDRYFISNTGLGQILERDSEGNLSVFANNMSGPHGLEVVGDTLFACSGGNLRGFDINTGEQVINHSVGGQFLNGITHNGDNIFFTDFSAKRIYRYHIPSNTHNLFTSVSRTPNGILYDDIFNRLLVVCWGNNAPIYEVNLSDSSYTTVVTTTLGNCDGIGMNDCGEYYVSAWSTSAVHKFNSDFSTDEIIASQLSSPADIYYNRTTNVLAIPNSGDDTVDFVELEQCVGTILFECIAGACEESANGTYTSMTNCEAACGSINIDEFTAIGNLSPNPASISSTLQLPIAANKVQFVNSLGQVLYQETLFKETTMRTPNLPTGLYHVIINQEIITKVLIQK